MRARTLVVAAFPRRGWPQRGAVRYARFAVRTLRPLNKCRACGMTWYPRGKDLSPRCPNCGSHETRTIHPGCGCLVVLVAVVAVVGLCTPKDKRPEHDVTPSASEAPAATLVRRRSVTKDCDAWGFDDAGKAIVLMRIERNQSVQVVGSDEKSTAVSLDGKRAWLRNDCFR